MLVLWRGSLVAFVVVKIAIVFDVAIGFIIGVLIAICIIFIISVIVVMKGIVIFSADAITECIVKSLLHVKEGKGE